MKRRTIASLCLALAMCFALLLTAQAANETDIKTTVSYVVEAEPEATESIPTTSQPRKMYELSIPAEIDLNSSTTIPLELTYNGLQGDEAVRVIFDAAGSLDNVDAYLHLTSENSTDVMNVVVFTRNAETQELSRASSVSTYPIAEFSRLNNYTPKNDAILFWPVDSDNISPGTYTGTVHFIIELIHI